MEKQTKIKQKRDLACPVTGLVVEDKDSAIEAIGYIDQEIEKHKATKKAIKEDYDITTVKYIYQRGRYYNKIYKDTKKDILKLSVNARSLFMTFICVIDKDDNSIRVNNKHASQEDLISLTGMSRRVLQDSLHELSEAYMIKLEGGNRNRKIFVNPKMVEDTATDVNIHNKFP